MLLHRCELRMSKLRCVIDAALPSKHQLRPSSPRLPSRAYELSNKRLVRSCDKTAHQDCCHASLGEFRYSAPTRGALDTTNAPNSAQLAASLRSVPHGINGSAIVANSSSARGHSCLRRKNWSARIKQTTAHGLPDLRTSISDGSTGETTVRSRLLRPRTEQFNLRRHPCLTRDPSPM